MRITKDDRVFFQNKYNVYIGNIESDESISFEGDFLILGDIRTPKNILSLGDIIIIGNMEAASVYMYKDLLCIGKINSKNVEIEGILKEIDKNVFKQKQAELVLENSLTNLIDITNKDIESLDKINSMSLEDVTLKVGDFVLHTVFGKGRITRIASKKVTVDFEDDGLRIVSIDTISRFNLLQNNGDTIKEKVKYAEIKNENKNTIAEKYSKLEMSKSIININDLKKDDIVIHKNLGEGKIIDINLNQITIDFIDKGERKVSTDITLKLYLLRKIYSSETNANTSNIKNNAASTKEQEHKLDKRIVEKPDKKIIDNLIKLKPIMFYKKDINEVNTKNSEEKHKNNLIHYIKYDNKIYVRLNYLCEIIDMSFLEASKYLQEFIRVDYFNTNQNNIRFVEFNELLNLLNDSSNNTLTKEIDSKKIKQIYHILMLIKKESNGKLENAQPYMTLAIYNILKNKNTDLLGLAKIWNVRKQHLQVVLAGFPAPIIRLEELVRKNNCPQHIDEIRKVDLKLKDLEECNVSANGNIHISNTIVFTEESEIDEETNEDTEQVIIDEIYLQLGMYNYSEENIHIHKIYKEKDDKFIFDIEIIEIENVSTTISTFEYLTHKISRTVEVDLKLKLVNFNIMKLISEIIEVNIENITLNVFEKKCTIKTDSYEYQSKVNLVDENSDYLKSITGYSLELTAIENDDIDIKPIKTRNYNDNTKILIEEKKSESKEFTFSEQVYEIITDKSCICKDDIIFHKEFGKGRVMYKGSDSIGMDFGSEKKYIHLKSSIQLKKLSRLKK